MRKFGGLLAALVLGLVTAPVQAQGFRGGMGMGGGSYMLLRNKSVQQELKLGDEKAEKITKIVDEIGAKAREKMEAIPQEERREKGREVMMAAGEEIKTAVKDLVTTEQTARLEQIILQQRGIGAFTDAKIQEKLNLTDDQKGKLKEIGESTRTQMTELRQEFQNDREGAMKKMATIRKESWEKATALLTDSQKKTWKELTGEPFEIKFERPPGA